MRLNSKHLEATYVRRRDIEHQRVERTQAVSQYYDHWGKVTSRFENWVTPEYYKQADEQVRQKQEKKEKAAKLSERQEKLRKLFASENLTYEEEQRARSGPRGRRSHVDTNTLKRIEENIRERDNIRRKLELEAKLYGKWRKGVDDENAIFESKSSHEVLAKLNWLDKQVDAQLQREREEAEAEERKLRMQVELAKSEEVQMERQRIREQEIKEIRALQQQHLEQLKERQAETDELKQQEKQMRSFLQELDKELELAKESSAVASQQAEISQAYNLKKIKVFIRKRSELFRSQIKTVLNILQRVSAYCTMPDKLREFQQKCQDQLELETLAVSQIEAMYESEAKASLQHCEEMWQTQQLQRYQDLKKLLQDEQCSLAMLINDNLERQTDSIEMRTTHLRSIENSNEKLKQLIQEQENSPRGYAPAPSETAASPRGADSISLAKSVEVMPAGRVTYTNNVPRLSNSFNNLNLDVWQDVASARGVIDSPRLQSQRSQQVVTAETAERPKFARKRVAWT